MLRNNASKGDRGFILVDAYLTPDAVFYESGLGLMMSSLVADPIQT
jgi:hypothetical protein